MPGASVKIQSLEDNSIRSTTSDQNGSFEFVNLKPGNYALSAEAPGSAEFRVPSAKLASGKRYGSTSLWGSQVNRRPLRWLTPLL
ncbi:MAG: carboxypeptidase-like regulatory domain-containing protein [Candidatus Sulfotelmatobacter sp.]